MNQFKEKLYIIIFEADTPLGKAWDIALILSVLASVLVVMLESVESLKLQYDMYFEVAEWLFTILFTIELVLRLISTNKKAKYIFSFYGIVDILSILPSYLAMISPGLRSLEIIRTFRLLRIFRILKLNRYMIASSSLSNALNASKPKIIVFLGVITTLAFIMGAIMYLVEGKENGFTSIPKSIYWAIVTVTTVGFGDVVPKTALGQLISSLLMILGYGIIAVPTGLVTSEIVHQKISEGRNDLECSSCGEKMHENNAAFCFSCGHQIGE
ncbi:ion transporter [Bacteriovoracaceae bacterium]|nr:ion transporter [Bacteriovoracaceae bacterium]